MKTAEKRAGPARTGSSGERISRVRARAYTIPTDQPESDGSFSWNDTTMVAVHVEAGGQTGFGYTYSAPAVAGVVDSMLAPRLHGENALDVARAWRKMRTAIRNNGETGVAMMAVSAVDNALWDLKARLLGVPLSVLLGRARNDVEVYGSGGFTSYDAARMEAQLGGWADDGMRSVKIKVGRRPDQDPGRVRFAARVVGPDVNLMVDANGAYDRKQALLMAELFADEGVVWFEEPVHHHDIEGLRLLSRRVPAGMDVSAGEYCFQSTDFMRLLRGRAVDVLQADATRCGTTGFMAAATLCEAFKIPFSSHCAPSLHVALACSAPRFRHIEYFYDHARIEQRYLDGAPRPLQGRMRPDSSRPGNGLELKQQDIEPFGVP